MPRNIFTNNVIVPTARRTLQEMHGIPDPWEVVEQWLDVDLVPVYPEETTKALSARKYDNIPMLPDYSVPPSEVFWDKFPKRDLPKKAETKISSVMLDNLSKEID